MTNQEIVRPIKFLDRVSILGPDGLRVSFGYVVKTYPDNYKDQTIIDALPFGSRLRAKIRHLTPADFTYKNPIGRDDRPYTYANA